MIKKGFWLLFLALGAHAQVPELLDLRLSGTSEDAIFAPNTLQLQVGRDYLLVLDNPFEVPYYFNAPTFADAITTQYIQGSAAVTRTSVQISPESKVQWLFHVNKPGKFQYQAQIGQGHLGHSHQPGMIHIQGQDQPSAHESVPQSSIELPEGGYQAVLKSNEVDYEPQTAKRRHPPKKRPVRGRPS